MSNIEATRVMGAVSPSPDRTMVVPAGGMPTQMGGGDPMRTQMGGTTSCPVCKSVTLLMEPYCGDCGFLLTSAPPEETEAPPQEAAPAELIALTDGRRFRLNVGVNTVGRQGTDVLITDATISRNHAKITLENGTVTVEDLGSSNGTKVGDLRLSANQPTTAPTGTVLKFGNWQARLEIGGGAAGASDKTVVVSDRTMVGTPPTDDRTIVGIPPVGADTPVVPPIPDETAAEAGPLVAMLTNEQGPSPDIRVTPATITIGRRAGNTLVFPNDAYISGKHAEITTDSTGTYLTDTGSTNGTFVNGQRMVVGERQLLLEGDEVQLGQTRYRFTPVAPAEEPSEPIADVYAEGAGLETSVQAEKPIGMSDTDVYMSAESTGQEPTAKFDRAELVRGWREYEAVMPRCVPVIKFAAKTDMGQVRENNEDKFEFYEPEAPEILAARGCLYAVADGIGGAQAGQIASETMLKKLIANYYDSAAPDLVNALYDSIVNTNDYIYSLAQMIPERNGMGTTLTGVIFIEDRVVVAQVGDSRAYLIRDGAVRQVTQDHSWVEEQVRAGLMTRHAAEMSPFRNVITRSIGAMPNVDPEFFEEQARPGDVWVLCSDGLTGYVSDEEICQIAGKHAPSEAARQFLELANARGGRDNITAFVLAVRELCPFMPESASAGLNGSAAAVVGNGSAALPIAEPPRAAAPATGLRKLFGRS